MEGGVVGLGWWSTAVLWLWSTYVRSLLQCTCFTVKSECNLTIENQGWFYQTYKLLWDVLGTFHWGVTNKLKWPNVCMKWLFFTLLFFSVLVWAGAGSWNQRSTGPTMKFLEPFESARRFLFLIDSTSRLLQLSWIPLFFLFFFCVFTFRNVICISQSRSNEKEGCCDPIWDGQCFTAFSDSYLTDYKPHASLW